MRTKADPAGAASRSIGCCSARIELTDPEGGTERIEYHLWGAALGLSGTVPSGDVPAGFSDLNQGLGMFNSLHWDKRAMAEAPGNVARATITHWLARAGRTQLSTGNPPAAKSGAVKTRLGRRRKVGW